MLAVLCYNDPTQISKMIENGILPTTIDSLTHCMPVDPFFSPSIFEFVRMISIHEKGKDLIKEKEIFKKMIKPLLL